MNRRSAILAMIASPMNRPAESNSLQCPILQVDEMLDGYTQYRLITGIAPLMNVPDEIRSCVVFLMYRTKSGDLHSAGTAFFTSRPLPGVAHHVACYLVTARHVIEDISKYGNDGKVHIRAHISGLAKVISCDMGSWSFPEDPKIDAATIPVGWLTQVDNKFFPHQSFADQEFLTQEAIGIGDDVFAVGLFSKHIGTGRNIPILRTGIISAMPEEPVQTKKLGEIEAFLVELRSIGGLSGSPVFVRLGPIRRTPEGMAIKGYSFRLLGLIHGHWDLHDDDLLTSDGPFGGEKLNTGIAVVVPAYKITELLDDPRFQKDREKTARKILEANLPEPDVSSDGDMK